MAVEDGKIRFYLNEAWPQQTFRPEMYMTAIKGLELLRVRTGVR